jgi:hypothetical protein
LYNALSAVDFSVAFTNQSAFTFNNLAFVAGDFYFSYNDATNAAFPALSVVVGDFFVSSNVFLVSFQSPALNNIGGVVSIVGNNVALVIGFSASLKFQVPCTGGSGSEYTDLLYCTRISEDRQITASSATALVLSLLTSSGGFLRIETNTALASINLPTLTYTSGHLTIRSNAILTTINFLSLITVVGALNIWYNPFLTFASLPKLTYIGSTIGICANNAAFRIPSGPPYAPTGGFMVNGSSKGQVHCNFQQGASTCTFVTCP